MFLPPEYRSDIFTLIIKPLVGSRLIEGTVFRDVRTYFQKIKQLRQLRLHFLSARIKSKFHVRITTAHITGYFLKSSKVAAFSKKEKAVGPEIIRDYLIHCRMIQLLPDIFP